MKPAFVYLDHAATSFPKPPAVLSAMQRWYAEVGVSPDRGDGDRCRVAGEEIAAARRLVADLVGVDPSMVAFHSGATESANLVLRAVLRPGDAVVATAFEHSSVARPLVALQRERGLRLHVVAPGPDGLPATDAVVAAVRDLRPRLLAFPHASNVTGACFDAAGLCEAARKSGVLSFIDASQTAGLLDLRVGADFLVASAHKALLGPPGLGFVAARTALEPQKQGGTGSSRALAEHPRTWPIAFEAGTPNTPAIFGLAAALRLLAAEPAGRRLAASLAHADILVDGLLARKGVRVHHPRHGPRVPVLSFVHAAYDPAELGALFAAGHVHVRTGFHCAPWLHEHLGTERAGTVRLSPGPDTTAAELAAALALVP